MAIRWPIILLLLACGRSELPRPQAACSLETCPIPDSACETPACVAGNSCGVVPVPDGTSCGASTCADARVCLSGRCVSRPVPSDQPCAEVVAGAPAGCGSRDGQGEAARLGDAYHQSLLFDETGAVWVGERSTIRRISSNGAVRTIAGDPNISGFVDGYRSAARLTSPTPVGFDESGNLIIAEADAAERTASLRKISTAGVVSSWVGNLHLEGHALEVVQERDGQISILDWGTPTFVYRVSPAGEVRRHSVEKHPDEPRREGNTEGFSAGPAGVFFCPTPSSTFELLPSGQVTPTSAENCLVQFRGVNGMYRRSPWELQRAQSDGGFETLVMGKTGDGTYHTFTIARDGGVAALDANATSCTLVRFDNGQPRVVAGPSGRDDVIETPASMLAQGNRVFIADTTHLRLLSEGVVSAVYSAPGDASWPRFTALFASPSGNQILAQRTQGAPMVVDLLTGTATEVDAPTSPSYWASTGAIYIGGHDARPVLVGRDGELELGSVMKRAKRSEGLMVRNRPAKMVEIARFELDGGVRPLFEREWGIIDIAEEPTGNILFIDFQSHVIRRLRIDASPRVVEPVAEIDHEPRAIAVTDDGTIWVGVPNAIVRLRIPR